MTDDSATPETGLEALQSTPEFRGQVEPFGDHEHANDHFALIYGSQAEQFAAAIPFIRNGLERGERCLYIADENSEEDILDAMRNHGIDVDTALESGSLSVHTKQETYLRNGTFDPGEMIAFLADAIDETRGEYEGLRTTGEMAWILDDDAHIEDLIEYEAKLNHLLSDESCVSLCQYNRERFPADVIRDVISTHPLVIHDGRISHNVYYTPPEEFFGPDKAEREVERLLGSLREQTDAKAELHQREHFLREGYRITSDPDLNFEEQLHRLLDLARDRTDLDAAGLTYRPECDGKFRIEYALGYGDGDGDGVVDPADDLWTDPGEGCFCRQAVASDDPVGKADVRGTDWADDPIHREQGLTCYLGTQVTSGATPYGTLWVGGTEPRDRDFSDAERTFLELIGQWVSTELERRDRTDAQRELYEIAADPDRAFEEKLDAVFDLGCERFDLELGGLAEVDPAEDRFEVEYVSDDHDHLFPGAEAALSETYCRVTTDHGSNAAVADPVAVTDPVADGFEDIASHEEFGVRAYLGSHLEVEGGADRTFWFVSETPREDGFSEAERAFHNLMGQWVQYELERRRREQDLRDRTEHLRALVETTPDCIKTVGPDGTLLQMNLAGLDMVGAESASDVTGECVYDLIAPEHRERFREFNERICRGERGTLEFDIVGLEGTRRHMESHAAPLERSDGTTVQVAVTRDITERDQREQVLVEQNELLEQIAAGAPLEECLTALCAAVPRLNPDVRASILLADEERESFEHSIAPDFPPSWGDRLEGAAIDDLVIGTCGAAVFQGESITCEDIAENDEWATGWRDLCIANDVLAGHSEPILNADGDPEGSFTLCFDEPRGPNEWERRLADFGTHIASVALERDRSRRALRERKWELKERTERLDNFAGMLAHELRNPTMIGQIYSQQLPDEADSEAVEYVTEAFDRIEDIIDVMLVLTRGREAVGEQTPVALGNAARDAWAGVDASDAAFDVEIDDTIEANETYVQNLFRNLLENAVEHGGEDVTVTVGELNDSGGFYVADDGEGIPADQRDAIFDEGYTTAAGRGGTGLGLAFVRKLADVYGWDFAVTESSGGGARFEFRNVA